MKRKSVKIKKSKKQLATVPLPDITNHTENVLQLLTAALGVDRNVIASEDQIREAWSRLPNLLRSIPPELRDEKLVKACVAIASGLFDSAINYVWNAAIVELRAKVHRFGIHVIPQILGDRSFDDDRLQDMKDAELLELCLKLNLITKQAFFFLDQCRATRNNYSVAHPSEGTVDEHEVSVFISRCQKYALSSTRDPKGVDTKRLLKSLTSSRFTRNQRETWEGRLRGTFEAQRELIFEMLHGIYCDPDSGEEGRVNALDLCISFRDEFSLKAQSAFVDRHHDYKAKGDDRRYKASQQFFEKTALIRLLGELEIHSIITTASRNLLRVHNDWNNFYNEPPFAERLQQITQDQAIPESAQAIYVEAVVTCSVGNSYGVSNAAMPYYRSMVQSLSPREIGIMLRLPKGSSAIAGRLKSSSECKQRFRELVRLLDESSVPTSRRSAYRKWVAESR